MLIADILPPDPDLKEHSAQGVDVGATVHRLVALLLRRPIARRARLVDGAHAGLGQVSHAEVAQLDLGVVGQQDILRLDVPMDDPQSMDFLQGSTQVQRPVQRQPQVGVGVFAEIALQAASRHQLHHDEEEITFREGVAHLDNPLLVSQPAADAAFLLDPFQVLRIKITGVNDLDGDGLIQVLVVALPDHAVGSVTDRML